MMTVLDLYEKYSRHENWYAKAGEPLFVTRAEWNEIIASCEAAIRRPLADLPNPHLFGRPLFCLDNFPHG